MTVIVSSAELPEPTDTDFHGSGAAAWNIAGPLDVLWLPRHGDVPPRIGIGCEPTMLALNTQHAREFALALLAACEREERP
ncbi:hypothetical protein DL990_40990 [Amycolatopsis sp. WAC 01416]|uniref:hypothetical protein n=1 Tax=Amycolatopsis sp. WAC 01416 TaxID=2203196 RepID=UPI000F7BA6E8|nr:hypothetical protein [Amycolatopsis sp. WAC 01416]RSN19886.1 hypothetical protein DL990_40990 [Amycolatopsis sp. WAC 01416]